MSKRSRGPVCNLADCALSFPHRQGSKGCQFHPDSRPDPYDPDPIADPVLRDRQALAKESRNG